VTDADWLNSHHVTVLGTTQLTATRRLEFSNSYTPEMCTQESSDNKTSFTRILIGIGFVFFLFSVCFMFRETPCNITS
jgi:hypothetical protein